MILFFYKDFTIKGGLRNYSTLVLASLVLNKIVSSKRADGLMHTLTYSINGSFSIHTARFDSNILVL